MGRREVAAALVLLAGPAVVLSFLLRPVPRDFLRGDRLATLVITDRNGIVLREIPSSRHGTAYWTPLGETGPWLGPAVIAAEDHRFRSHFGIDPVAVARSVVLNLRRGRVVAGGSTITQQLARNLAGARRRTLPAKLAEAALALRLELHLSKDEILEAYLNRVCFGNQAYGVGAAARLYFDRPPSELSLAQSCLLAAIPRSPVGYDPLRQPAAGRRRQRWILAKLRDRQFISEEQLAAALAESIVLAPRSRRFRAPHFTDAVVTRATREERKSLRALQTTLDWRIQATCEALLEGQLVRLAPCNATNGAVVVLDRRGGDILAMVGSRDYLAADGGQVNAALARRQPGSALKPFVYALAFEHGAGPATALLDVPHHFAEPGGDYAPRNCDREFRGLVSARTALACSYNIPAVRLADQYGVEALLGLLRASGFSSLDRSATHYGRALVLGTGEVTLLELVNAYRMLANCGCFSPARWLAGPDTAERRRALSPAGAYLVTDILRDDGARTGAFGQFSCLALPFDCAVKTGTSKDCRDNWAIGYTDQFVVGVWVGNFNGTPMRGATGVTGAGPLLRDVMLSLHATEPARMAEPEGVRRVRVCPVSGHRPVPACPADVEELFAAGSEPRETCSMHRVVVSDRRTGRRAGVSTPEWARAEKAVMVPPPELRAWLADVESEPGAGHWGGEEDGEAGDAEAAGRPAVLFPDDGDVFKIDPDVCRSVQAVRLRAAVPLPDTELTWYLDGRVLARARADEPVFWELEPGRHRLAVQAGGELSQPVRFVVLR